jgi:hypothetical protein
MSLQNALIGSLRLPLKRVLVTLAFIGMTVLVWFALLWAPEWMANQYRYAEAKDWAAQVTANRTLLLSMIGGIGVAITIVYTYRTFTLTQDKMLTETMAKAIEHLSPDNSTARLGGVFTLARIARQSQKDYFAIIQLLASFVRTRDSEADMGPGLRQSDDSRRYNCPDDVRTALTIIGNRYWPDPDGYGIELSYSKIRNAWLPSANFCQVFFWGSDFRNVFLEEAKLCGAEFRNATLDSCVFTGVDFTDADLSGARITNPVGLTKRQLSRAKNVPSEILAGLSD